MVKEKQTSKQEKKGSKEERSIELYLGETWNCSNVSQELAGKFFVGLVLFQEGRRSGKRSTKETTQQGAMSSRQKLFLPQEEPHHRRVKILTAQVGNASEKFKDRGRSLNILGSASVGSKEQDLRRSSFDEGWVKPTFEIIPFNHQIILCFFQGQYKNAQGGL